MDDKLERLLGTEPEDQDHFLVEIMDWVAGPNSRASIAGAHAANGTVVKDRITAMRAGGK